MSLSTRLCFKLILSNLLIFSILPIIIFLATTDRILIKSDLVDRGTRTLHILSLTNSIYSIITLLFIIFLVFKEKYLKLSYIILIISILLSIATTIVSSYVFNNYPDEIEIQSKYNMIDNFIFQVDQFLCSSSCPCDFWNTAPFSYNYVETYFSKMKKNLKKTGAVSFISCPRESRMELIRNYRTNLSGFHGENFEDITWYMVHIEHVFKCSGFYKSTYELNDQENMVFKYLFSDINRGIPHSFGCIDEINIAIDNITTNSIIFFSLASFFKIVAFIIFLTGRKYLSDDTARYSNIIEESKTPSNLEIKIDSKN